jgi:spore germination cell wall hydrolase CwlJ-like protein
MTTAKLLLLYILQTASIFGIDADTSMIDPEQAYCLAKNVYYESKGEDIRGQYAVASVTLNRVNDPRFPRTICEVVKQSTLDRITRRLICQFSWYCDENKSGKDITFKNKDGSVNQASIDQFQTASIVAISVLSGKVKDNTHGATHFHNYNISDPSWNDTLKRTVRLGNHDFYK